MEIFFCFFAFFLTRPTLSVIVPRLLLLLLLPAQQQRGLGDGQVVGGRGRGHDLVGGPAGARRRPGQGRAGVLVPGSQ